MVRERRCRGWKRRGLSFEAAEDGHTVELQTTRTLRVAMPSTPPSRATPFGAGRRAARPVQPCAQRSSFAGSRTRMRVRSSAIAPSRSSFLSARCTTSRTEPTMEAIS